MIKCVVSLMLAYTIGGAKMLPAQDNRVLMTIAEKQVTVDEFLGIYNKNNTSNVIDKKSMEEYLDLFINFKLKVQAAEDLGMDTVQKFINELAGYERQLAQPYLSDRDLNDQLIKEAYDRSTEDISAFHILVKVPENAPAKDTLAALKKLTNYRKQIKSEADMKSLLEALKNDGDDNTIAEDLGYFTAFSMVYPFESKAYNAEQGAITEPVRTRFGYHIIYVRDRRPARGEILVSHIMAKSDGENAEMAKTAKERIDEINEKIKAGEDFAELARQFSEDKGSAKSGGKLPWFGTGRMVNTFEDAAFGLENAGDISEPMQTNYGWHIIRKEDYRGLGTFDDLKSGLKKRIERDARGQRGRVSLLKKLKKDYALSHNYKNRDEVNRQVSNDFLQGNWKPERKDTLTDAVLTITDNVHSKRTQSFTRIDYFNYLFKFQKKQADGKLLGEVMSERWESFVNASVVDFERGNLDAKYPEFKALMQEYHDGILLFELMDERVWSKAVKDTTGLEAFYDLNKNNFMWDQRVDASVYECANEEVAAKVEKLAKKRLKKGLTDTEILNEVNKESALNLRINSGLFAKGANESIDAVSQTSGIQRTATENGKIALVQIYSTLEPQPKALTEARGLFTSAYQTELEEKWIADLRSKYSFNVDAAVFDSINK